MPTTLIPMTIQEQLALRIRTKRKILRLSQAELAKKIDTSQTVIARLENGLGNPTVNLIQRVVDALNLRVTLYMHPTKPPAESQAPSWLNQP